MSSISSRCCDFCLEIILDKNFLIIGDIRKYQSIMIITALTIIRIISVSLLLPIQEEKRILPKPIEKKISNAIPEGF